MPLDLLLQGVPSALGAAAAQAAQAYLRGTWRDEGGADVLPVALPDGVWLTMTVPYLGEVGIGVDRGRPALRMPAAVAWMLKARLPVVETRPEGGAMVLALGLQRGVVAWLDVPGGGRVGLRLVEDGEIV